MMGSILHEHAPIWIKVAIIGIFVVGAIGAASNKEDRVLGAVIMLCGYCAAAVVVILALILAS
jgi:hypothetical protein